MSDKLRSVVATKSLTASARLVYVVLVTSDGLRNVPAVARAAGVSESSARAGLNQLAESGLVSVTWRPFRVEVKEG